MWKNDLWGCRAIAMKAHVLLLQGEPEKAKSVLRSSMPFLEVFDAQLGKRETAARPMRELRE